ncbi:putative flavin-containing monoamine oxidase AofH [Meiothermus hypogaeus]|uniref:Flavin-containing monoamine oxidase AofH n=2 Tax=Meiothermus hypogaeus TaxID=884155 RepID=A0ABX9MHS3_9DEIN|nr:putative flavin-containing monoamine oxidase AofH [Meiothermus hypogaeus]
MLHLRQKVCVRWFLHRYLAFELSPSHVWNGPIFYPETMTDVLVVGAGFAGMVAARELLRRGYRVVVLEARDRVGGRVLGGQVGGLRVDFGGTWRGPHQTALDALAAEFGVGRIPQYATGRRVLEIGGQRKTYRGLVPPVGLRAAWQTGKAIAQLNQMARKLPQEAPWQAPVAATWDAQTVADWQAGVSSEAARRLFDVATRAILCAEPQEVSLLYFLAYIRAAGSLESLAEVKNGAQQDRLEGGMHGLAQKLGESLGESLVLSSPVQSIVQETDSVTVHAESGRWQARRVIVAVPPLLAAEIAFSPPLPDRRRQLQVSMPMGSVIKCFAAYAKPFWRAQGLSGEAISDSAVVSPVFDLSPPDGSLGILVGFIDGAMARMWSAKTLEERRAEFVRCMVRFFGPEAAHPLDYADHDWTKEPWSRGCYEGYMPPQVMTRYGAALREPVGLIHWAGTETATVWTGYVEGAIRSGQRAAQEVAVTLG